MNEKIINSWKTVLATNRSYNNYKAQIKALREMGNEALDSIEMMRMLTSIWRKDFPDWNPEWETRIAACLEDDAAFKATHDAMLDSYKSFPTEAYTTEAWNPKGCSFRPAKSIKAPQVHAKKNAEPCTALVPFVAPTVFVAPDGKADTNILKVLSA
jgi:hypothetical protein